MNRRAISNAECGKGSLLTRRKEARSRSPAAAWGPEGPDPPFFSGGQSQEAGCVRLIKLSEKKDK